jgi:Leucine-rich repeat (LRR) protein
MKFHTLSLVFAVMTYPCLGQAQDPFERATDDEAAETINSASFCGDEPVDLDSIRGKPIKNLSLMGCGKLSDISAVAGMKLEDLELWKTQIKDISPLAGMPLKKLVIFGCPVKDLSPLKGMPLESLWIGATEATDFSPLKGLPLKHLSLYSSVVTDISPLEGMPLEDLDLSTFDSGRISDLTPLHGMKLKRLVFHANTVTKGMDLIRDMKSLEEINQQTPTEFWRKYDADTPARNRLRELGIHYRTFDVADDGSWSLGFHGDDIGDLSVLKNLPVSTLSLQESTIEDLSPLEGSKITCLNLHGTTVKDLSPLGKTSLKTLYLFCPKVDDISPLEGLPLEYLHLGCPKVTDVAALRGMPLNTLFITGTGIRDVSSLEGLPLEFLFVDLKRITRGIETLREMKSLKHINNQDAKKVWQEHDADPIHNGTKMKHLRK